MMVCETLLGGVSPMLYGAFVVSVLLVSGWLLNQYLKEAGGVAPPPGLPELVVGRSGEEVNDDGE